MELLAVFTMMYRYLIIFLLSMIINLCAHAQGNESLYADSTVETDDTETKAGNIAEITSDTILLKRHIPGANTLVDSLKSKKEFAYMAYMDSILKFQQNKKANDVKKARRSLSFLDRLFNTSFLKIIFWLIAGIVVLFILVKLFNTTGIFKRKSADSAVQESKDTDTAYTQNDYSKLIQQSCRLGDYRMAVKYLFLSTLQQLANSSLVEYASDKTNFQYVQEVPADKKNEFSKLVLNYEYIWYGNLHIDKEFYEKIEMEFTSFRKKIN